MPDHVRKALLKDAEPYRRIHSDGSRSREFYADNETRGVIPILADICNIDPMTKATYLCHPSTRHIVKIRCDGNFCGYWNIQMMLTYLNSHHPTLRPPSRDSRERPIPNILEIQDDIERAWDSDICAYGRVETGGIRGTRKWIGTHEALAYFLRLGIEVEALSFRQEDNDSTSQPGVLSLLDHVEAYFISAMESSRTKHHGTSHTTPLPPLYFQRFGHSMTIVGLERKMNGQRNLLVFDSSCPTSSAMGKLLAGRTAWTYPDTMLTSYRRSDMSLSRWEEFEIIAPKVWTMGN
jgi:zinc finger-containing ubiquitin peptidase 1